MKDGEAAEEDDEEEEEAKARDTQSKTRTPHKIAGKNMHHAKGFSAYCKSNSPSQSCQFKFSETLQKPWGDWRVSPL